MKFFKANWEIFQFVPVIIGILFVLLPISPLNMPYTYRDSGVFLYSGWRILNGEIPYRDFWDHKPPVIFFINAFGLLIGHGSHWGVWVLECVALLGATVLLFNLIKKSAGYAVALFGLYLFLVDLAFLIDGGNYTTEYTLPLQVGAIWLASTWNAERSQSQAFWLGLMAALAFFTKQTVIGVFIAVVLAHFVQSFPTRQFGLFARSLARFIFGGLIVVLALLLYFLFNNALAQFWDAAFVYNTTYTALPWAERWQAMLLISNHFYFSKTGFFIFAVLGWCIVVYKLFKKEYQPWPPALLWICVLDFPLEIFFVNLSGRSHPHYFMTVLPIMAILAACFFEVLSTFLQTWWRWRAAPLVITTLMLGLASLILFPTYYAVVREFHRVQYRGLFTQIVPYIQAQTTEQDTVLMWGAETGVNFFTRRLPPGRFNYLYPLYTKGYSSSVKLDEFLQALEARPPAMIIDAQDKFTPLTDFAAGLPQQAELLNFIQKKYTSDTVGGWTVYTYKGP